MYLLKIIIYYTLKRPGDTEKIAQWKSKGLSTKKVITPTTTENILFPSIKWYENLNFCLVFKESCLKQQQQQQQQKTQFILIIIEEIVLLVMNQIHGHEI